MNRTKSIMSIGVMLFLLVSCSPAAAAPKAAPQATQGITPQAAQGITPQIAQGITPQAAQRTTPYPMSEYGPYYVGKTALVVNDGNRDNRQVSITVWYPAAQPEDPKNRRPIRDAAPDTSGKPYPLILSSTKMAQVLAPYLVSHGFAWASIDGIDYYDIMNEEVIDQPLDILFALNRVTVNPPKSLESLIDVEHAGMIGYSFDGYNALAISGARIDPAYYLAQCPTPDATTKAVLTSYSPFSCIPADDWEKFAAHADATITASEDGLWQPMTDERIRAVMPIAGEGWWLFGKKGLAAVDRPILMIVGTEDQLYAENSLIFENLGASDKALISFVGQGHYMIFESEMIARMAHFTVAFFGYHLQDRKDLAWYFSEDFVTQQDDLAWGVYANK